LADELSMMDSAKVEQVSVPTIWEALAEYDKGRTDILAIVSMERSVSESSLLIGT